MNPDLRIQAAFASDHFKQVMTQLGIDDSTATRLLMAAYETEPSRRVTDIERRADPIARGSYELGKGLGR